MSTARRVVALALSVFLSAVLVPAQPGTAPDEPLTNWTTPRYWMPEKAGGAKNLEATDSGLEPHAVEGVSTPALAFTGVTPCRIVDTRGGNFSGDYGPPALAQGAPRSFTLTGQCGIPGNAEAVSLNVTVVNTQGPGHLVIYPEGGAQPAVSTLNYVAGQTIANAAVVPLGLDGGITVVAGVSGTDLLLDTNGYYAPQTVVNTINTLSGAVTLAPGPNISITPSSNTLTIANTAPPGWSLTGNSISPGQFLGTTNLQPLELKAGGLRALRMTSSDSVTYPGSVNVVAGANSVTSPLPGLIPAGVTVFGGHASNPNIAGDNFATVAGGIGNTADGLRSVVGGGFANSASATETTVSGGFDNEATASGSAVGGGANNTASGEHAAIPGGRLNLAGGAYSFAAGRQAKADDPGAFVWGDGTGADINSTTANQFLVRANGGAVFIRGTASVPTVGAALTAQNGGSGEAAWLYTSSPSVPWPVLKLLKNSSATNNFLECAASGAVETTRCHITSAGSFVAGSDFAEALPAKGGKRLYEPGDVLVLSRDGSRGVEKSARRYDPGAIGVYSTRPGFIGADKDGVTRIDPNDVPVAITGIVPAKVTAENGPILPGDLLTTSSISGHAMKATPVSVAGVEIYPPGTILGKALEPLEGGKGTIRMLVLLR